jgi:hypothetical protein
MVALGFDNFVHFYNNEIYACKLTHWSLPNMKCNYKGAIQEADALIEQYGDEDGLRYAIKYNDDFPESQLVKCFESKLGRFRSEFLKKLRKRDCVKFTEDIIKTKIQSLKNPNGTFKLEPYRGYQWNTEYLFMYEDGMPCDDKSEECKIENPYENSEKDANAFNRRTHEVELFYQITEYAEHFASTEEKDKTLLEHLKQLPAEDKFIFTFKHEDTTIGHVIAKKGLLKCTEYILKKAEPSIFGTVDKEGNTILLSFIRSTFARENEKLKLLILVNETESKSIYIKNSSGYDILYIAVMLHYVSILEYLVEYARFDFENSMYEIENSKDATLLFVSCSILPWVTDDAFKIVKILLAQNVNPNYFDSNTADIFEYYFTVNPPLLKYKILKELCFYRYINKWGIDNLIEDFTDILKYPIKQLEYTRKLLSWHEAEIPENTNLRYEKEYEEKTNIFFRTLEYSQQEFKTVVTELIKVLKECKLIIERGGKKNSQLNMNVKKTKKLIKNNVKEIVLRATAAERVPEKYKEIDSFIKSVGARFTADEKKGYREKGITVLRNTNRNAVERYRELEALYNEIEEEAAKRMKGGRRKRFQKTKKNR